MKQAPYTPFAASVALVTVLASVPAAAQTAQELTRALNSRPAVPVAQNAPASPPATPSTSAGVSKPPATPTVPAPPTVRPAPVTVPATPPVPQRSGPQPPQPPQPPAVPAAPAARTAPVGAPVNAPQRPAAPTTTPATPSVPSAPATAAVPVPPAPPPVRVVPLNAAAIAALPFRIDLRGAQIVERPAGPTAKIYSISRAEKPLLMIYAGPQSDYPIYDGEQATVAGRTSVILSDGGVRRAVEHLFRREDKQPADIHIWLITTDGADGAVAEQIGQSVDPR